MTNNHFKGFEELRRKAEEVLKNKNEHPNELIVELDELIHELEVQHIELEMQNEELRKTQMELEDSRNNYYELYEFSPVGYITLNEDGFISRVNLTGTKILGTPRKYLINNAFIRFIAPDYKKIFHAHIQEVKNTHQKKQCEIELISPDKTPIFVSLYTTWVMDKERNYKEFRMVITDITPRMQAEEALKNTLDGLEGLIEERTHELLLSNRYNRNLIETSLDPLVTIGPDGKITDVNRATENVTGYSRDEIVGTDFADYFTRPEEAETGYQKVFLNGEIRDYPLEIKHENGSVTPVIYNASVYKDESGEIIGIFAAARDITEQKKAEEEIQDYWESLEELVKLRTEELAKSNEDLKQFAYVASHDLREPLRMISSFLKLLELRYKDQLDRDANEFIGYAVDGAKRLDKMIIDLLEYSQIANKEIKFTEVDLGEVMHQVKSNMNVLIKENNAKITYDSLPIIHGDENQLVILLQNLISNSIKYRREQNPQIHICAEKQSNQYVFCVKDNGIGIDPQYSKQIFSIFRRLHNQNEYEGSGIGLAIAQKIVHQHGGEIWAESELGKGSTFYFSIPMHAINNDSQIYS